MVPLRFQLFRGSHLPVTGCTVAAFLGSFYPMIGVQRSCWMAVSGWQLSRFERILLRAALVLAGLLVAVRIGAVVILTFLHHSR